jgi:hypothetical protein
MSVIEQRNQISWFAEPALMEWPDSARLNAIRAMMAPVMARPRVRQRVFGAIAGQLEAANAKLTDLLAADGNAQAAALGHLQLHEKVGPAVYHSSGAPHGTEGKDQT